MFGAGFFRAFSLLNMLAVASAGFHALSGQQQESKPATASAVARIPYSPFREIHVDENCRILPDTSVRLPGKKKTRPYKDSVICHLESVVSSEHLEETIVGSELRRSWVKISEQQYVLQNISVDPAIFVVREFVPTDWFVDSDPQPKQMDGKTAVFMVHADPGEIVRLHVGLRHNRSLRTKQI